MNFNSIIPLKLVAEPRHLSKEKSSSEKSSEKSCGIKHDILVMMHEFFAKEPQEGVVVPLPKGVTSEDVELFLIDQASQFFKLWEELGKIYGDQHPHFFDDPRVMGLISQSQSSIKEAFKQFALPDEMYAWLNALHYYMVRSSGAEDGKKSSNAGGNLSCNYVKPEEIALRMGEVVASYIDKRSLSNRIKAGENPFSSPHKLSVTVQELIGEAINGEKDPAKIPISLVLFTNEPLYIGCEQFRIMKFNASYGHGESVVGNQGILTDTAFVLQSISNPGELYIWYDKQEKLERLAPMETDLGIKLQRIANPEELVHERALSNEMIKRLFKLGLTVEKLFDGQATDMELVIKEGIIYIVQARPINRSISLPTYLDLDASFLQNPVEAKVLVPGSSNAFIIESREQILVEDTLEKASDALKDSHKLVITKEDEPINTHPIIRMSEEVMPCFYQKEGMEALMSELEGEKSLAVCMQQGIAALIDRSSDAAFKEGYITHPAPLSCPPSNLPWRKNRNGIPHEIQALLKQIRLEQNTKVALEAFQELAKKPLLKDLPNRITYLPLSPLAEEMQQRVNETLSELGATLSQDAGRLQILFYAKALETLLWGEGYSVIRIEELSATLSQYEQKLEGKKAALAEESLIEPLMAETGAAWVDFLIALEKNHPSSDIEALKKLLNCIGNARSLWLTFFFDRARKQARSSDDLVRTLLQGFDPESQAFVNGLRRQERIIDQFKTELFIDAASQQYALAQLLTIIKQFEEPKTIETFKSSSPLAKVIASQILGKAVALYDKSVKTMKTSPQYSLEIKAPLFKEMLGGYLSLLCVVVTELVGEGKFPDQGTSLKGYLDKLDEVLQQPIDMTSPEALVRILAASREFSVLAAMFGSGALFSRHYPETWEDLFTLIHQNLNACVSYLLAQNLSFQGLTPPPLFRETLGQIRSFRTTQFIGVEQNQDQLVLQYNAPLRNHSSTFQLTYRDGKVFLSAQLLGEARDRWTLTNQYLQILDTLRIQPLAKKPYQRGDVLNFTWCLEDKEQFAKALSVLDVVYEFSLNQNIELLNRDILARVSRRYPKESEQNEALEKVASSAEHFIIMAPSGFWQSWSVLLNDFIDRRKIVEKVKEVVVNLADAPSVSAKRASFQLLLNLISKDQAYKEASSIVEKFFDSSEGEVRRMALDILNDLVDKKESLEQAAVLSKVMVDDANDYVFDELIKLWEKLHPDVNVDPFSKDLSQKDKLEVLLHTYCQLRNEVNREEAASVMAHFANDEDPLIRRRIVQLMIALVDHGQSE